MLSPRVGRADFVVWLLFLFGFGFLGPSSLYAQSKPEATYVGVQVCKACHVEQFKTWSKTKHALDFSRFPFFGRTINMYTFVKGNCVSCHVTGLGKPGGYDLKKPWNEQTAMLRIQCENCHGPGSLHLAASSVKEKKANITRRPDPAAVCQTCHVTHYGKFPIGAATDKDIKDIPHGQSAMLYGLHGYEYPGVEYAKSLHVNIVKGTCVSCHLNPVRPHELKADIETCRTCHMGAKSFDVNARQTEIKGLVKTLKAKLDAFKKAHAKVTKDPKTHREKAIWDSKTNGLTFMRASYNYLFVTNDRSFGVHNYKYARDLLKSSITRAP